jgi:hypothetical protein
MYVILTSKPGQFRTELVPGLLPVEAYDYRVHGTRRAHFVIAELTADIRLRVVDEVFPPVVNLVPSKFLEKYQTLEAARRELRHLISFGRIKSTLDPVPAPEAVAA